MVIINEFYPERQGRPYAPPIPPFPTAVRGIHLAGEFSKTSKTDDYTAGDEMVILVDASGGSVIITLPEAATNSSKVYWIKNTGSTGTVTIKPDVPTELIEDESKLHLTLQGQYVMIICSGTKVVDSYWPILGGLNVRLEELIRQQLELLEKIRQEVSMSRLHLASKTDENFTVKDTQ